MAANNSSVWNPENIRDVAESIGLSSLPQDVVDHLTRDVEFRIAQVLEEALKFMRHAKRTSLFTSDISEALRVLDVEPLYGYESTRPLKFGEASIGPQQPLFYLEDEEVDFEKLINAPLPKVPREICFTAHWLAVEGVQPSIPQNPTTGDTQRQTEQGLSLLPKGAGPNAANTNAVLAATAGADNLSVKPLVKHILSKELQVYFADVCSALLDETTGDDMYRQAALSSLKSDPGLHQLVPYFIQFVADKVTHNLKNLFVLTQMMQLVSSLLDNPNIHITPYVSSLVPPVLTCLVGKRLGPAYPSATSSAMAPGASAAAEGAITTSDTETPHKPETLPPHYPLRHLASSVLQSMTRPQFTSSTPSLKPRLARTLLKYLLAPTTQPLGVYYGAILALAGIAGPEGVRMLLIPNLKAVDMVLKSAGEGAQELEREGGGKEVVARSRVREIDEVIGAIIGAIGSLDGNVTAAAGDSDAMDTDASDGEGEIKAKLVEKVGEVIGERIAEFGKKNIIKAVLESDSVAGAGL